MYYSSRNNVHINLVTLDCSVIFKRCLSHSRIFNSLRGSAVLFDGELTNDTSYDISFEH